MLYQTYQAQADGLEPFRLLAEATKGLLGYGPPSALENPFLRGIAASCALVSRVQLTHKRPAFEIPSIAIGNREVEVTEEAVDRTPFCTLLHFKKDSEAKQPPVLLVAPMSGHFATLLRDTVRTILPEHDVYITDWHNAREVSLRDGRFGFDEFVDHLIRFLERLGGEAHLIAICQPCVAALAAVAIMAEDENPTQPRSMTLMAGPIDTRINPTKVNEFATSHPLEWFERNLIGVVPQGLRGALRRVYPGFLQLSAFMGMNMSRHVKSLHDLYNHLVTGDREKASTTWKFYEEYFAVMDLPAEFFLETVQLVFQEHALAKGELTWHGRRIDCGAIRRPLLLTVEGERDDICAVGQTLAAQELCARLRPYKKRHYVQTGVGHYGAFSGRRWNTQIYPMVRDVIYSSA